MPFQYDDVRMAKDIGRPGSCMRRGLTALLLTAFCTGLVRADDEKTLKHVAKLDAELVRALSKLAQTYDELKDPEAAHFFASTALAFGAKDDKLVGIKNTWEVAVFIGKIRGGQILKDAEPITTALGGLHREYELIRDELWTPGTRGTLSEGLVKTLRDAGVKMELTQNAHEYIRVVQRFNALRQAMGLRAIFWDAEKSIPFILAAWYMGQTGDYEDDPSKSNTPANTHHVLYTQTVEEARKGTARLPNLDLSHYPDHLRGFSFIRQHLLNPNARTFSFAHWTKAWSISHMVLYMIPQLPYRNDIPTPSARFKDETVVKPWADWVDTEETLLVAGRKIPYVIYPYQGETDALCGSYMGEDGWIKDEYKHLRDTGVPIMLRFFVETVPSDVRATLSDSKEKVLSCRQYLTGDKRLYKLESWATVLLIPETRLAPSEHFTVHIECRVNDTPFEKSWGFTTRKE